MIVKCSRAFRYQYVHLNVPEQIGGKLDPIKYGIDFICGLFGELEIDFLCKLNDSKEL
jgi:hypothetical protein